MPEFNINIKESGEIVIAIKHKDKSNELSEQALKSFLVGAIKNGIQLKSVSGYTELGNPSASFEQYEITTIK